MLHCTSVPFTHHTPRTLRRPATGIEAFTQRGRALDEYTPEYTPRRQNENVSCECELNTQMDGWTYIPWVKATLEDVCDFVRATKLSHVELGQEEVLQIVNTLVYDGKVDAIEEFGDEEYDPDGDDWDGDVLVVYTPASLPIPESSAFTAVPCGVCPVFTECTPGGLVSPETCEYMKEWLAF